MRRQPIAYQDLIQHASALAGEDGFVWLDSQGGPAALARYSYIGLWPLARLQQSSGDLLSLKPLRHGLGALRSVDEAAAPFIGGWIGYLTYDFAPATVPDFTSRHGPGDRPLLAFGLYDTLLVYDHKTQAAQVLSWGLDPDGQNPDPSLAAQRIARVAALIKDAPKRSTHLPPLDWADETDADWFKAAVTQTQDYIRAGDIYQANISQKLTAPLEADISAFDYYLAFRAANPAPFSAFASDTQRSLACTSPERLIAADASGHVEARPIKGTIARDTDEARDAVQRQTLLASDKDRAENTMIVDLLRNDLSRVCAPHSVQVPQLCGLETYAGLHHLTSVVTGQMRDGLDAIDLLDAVFPGGSVTGAPKQRAMEIIDTLETGARGPFCGAFGYIGFDGAMDFNIMIRTIDLAEDQAALRVGSGLTLLSDPAEEYAETNLKAARLKAARGKAEALA